MKRYPYHIVAFAVLAAALISCSTTKVLSEGEHRLVRTKVEITNDRDFNSSALMPYVRQKGKGWDPFLVVYNWAGPDTSKFVNRIIRNMGVAPVVYDSSAVNNSISNIGRHLEYLGYYNSKVSPSVSFNGKKAYVRYKVTLGRRYLINSIRYELPDDGEIAADFLSDTASVTVRPGDYLSEAALEAESERSASWLRNQGYYGFDKNYFFFEADTLAVPSEASLVMKLSDFSRNDIPSDAKPHMKFTFGDVTIQRPESFKVRDKVLRNLNTVKPGMTYSDEIVNNTYSRLSALKIFSNVSVELNQKDSNTVDCDIHLSPSRLQGFKVNLEGSTNSSGLLGISPELSYYHKNIFKGGERLSLGFMGNFQSNRSRDVRSTEFGVNSGLSLPRFLFLPSRLFKSQVPRTEFTASYSYQNRPEYTRNILSTSFGYTWDRGNFHYQYAPLQLNIVNIYDMSTDFLYMLLYNPLLLISFQNHFDLGHGGTFYYTTDASANPKGSYHYVKIQFSSVGNVLSIFKNSMSKDDQGSALLWGAPFSQYVKSEITLGRTWKIGQKDGYAVATRLVAGLGLAYGNSGAMPFEQYFYGGGASSLRGWQTREVGPGYMPRADYFVIPNQYGDIKLEANIEYRFPIVWKLAGASFFDIGNVWMRKSQYIGDEPGLFHFNDFYKSIAASWGLGIRVDLNFILLRLDFGMKVHDPSRDEGDRLVGPDKWLKGSYHAWHFGVGYPF